MEKNPVPDLLEEILFDIFSRLPTKSVGKCRCLSKSWRTTLSSTSFIKKHLTTRQLHQQNLALIASSESLHIVTSPLKNDEQVTKCPMLWTRMLGSCNGLFLLLAGGEDEYTLVLLNPITLQQVKIPRPIHLSCDWFPVYGLGYDCSTDDFKVIVIYSRHQHKPIVDVFPVKSGVWNSLDNSCYPYGEELTPSKYRDGAFVNGAVHWPISKKDSGYLLCHIAAFDLANEIFHELPIPAQFNRNSRCIDMADINSGLAVIGGCLSIVHNLKNGATDIWLMKEYGVAKSWVKFHIVAHDYGESIVPMCFVGDEQLMCYTDMVTLIACDLKDGTSKKLIVGGADTWYMEGKAFVDSLISPGKCELDDGSS